MGNKNTFHFLELVLGGYKGLLSTTQHPDSGFHRPAKLQVKF